MKKIIRFIKFELQMRKTKRNVPNIKEYYSAVDTDFRRSGNIKKINLKGTLSFVQKILPLQSLNIVSVYLALREVTVTFDINEFNDYYNMPINSKLLDLCETYNKYSLTNRFYKYYELIETFDTVMDCVNSKLYNERESDIIELIDYLITEIGEDLNENRVIVEDKLSFELDFIRKQKENSEFLHKFQK